MQEELDHMQGEFIKRAKQCPTLDPHNYAGKPKKTAKGVHDQRRQKMFNTYEASILEVKGAQQGLNPNPHCLLLDLNLHGLLHLLSPSSIVHFLLSSGQ